VIGVERIKILKIDSLALLKALSIIGGVGGIILGLIIGLLLKPSYYTTGKSCSKSGGIQFVIF